MPLRNWNTAPRAAFGFSLIALMVALLGVNIYRLAHSTCRQWLT